MNKHLRYLLLTAGVAALAAVVAVAITALNRGPQPASASTLPSPAPAQAEQSPGTQLSDAGGVQVQASLVPPNGGEQVITIAVSLNTHSVELGQFDLAKLSRITLEPGGTLSGVTWTPKGSGGGHHVEGMLTVSDPNGLLKSAKSVALEISDLAAPDLRRFQWPVEKR